MKNPKLFAVLPTLLTLGNAACGFGAITLAAKVGPANFEGSELFIAAQLIFLGMVFDMFDGSAARWTKQTSEFGAQLDSLCDAVTFGVAPAFVMLQMEFAKSRQLELPFSYHSRLLWVIAMLFVVCVLLRLARFNVETEEDDSHEYFSGLPSPAAAGTVASFSIALGGLNELASEKWWAARQVVEWMVPALILLLPLVTLGVACLMVSRFRYSHVFNQMFRGQQSRQHLIQIVFSLALVFLVHWMAIPLLFCYYAFSAPLRAFWREIIIGRLYKSVRT